MKPLQTGDKVTLRIGTDTYDETVTAVSKSGIITVDGMRFKEIKKLVGEDRLYFYGMGDASSYRVHDNRDGKIVAHLDQGF